jgi:hypothetical protein
MHIQYSGSTLHRVNACVNYSGSTLHRVNACVKFCEVLNRRGRAGQRLTESHCCRLTTGRARQAGQSELSVAKLPSASIGSGSLLLDNVQKQATALGPAPASEYWQTPVEWIGFSTGCCGVEMVRLGCILNRSANDDACDRGMFGHR